MPKQLERDSTEFYKSEIRSLRKQVKQLERQLKYYQKQEHIFNDILSGVEEEVEVKEKKTKCTSCGKGNLNIIDIMGRIFSVCPICKDRLRVK